MTDTSVPATGLELRSTVTESDSLATLALREYDIAEPGPDEVVVRVGAAPINPSDMGMLFAGGDVSAASSVDGADLPAVAVPLSDGVLRAQRARWGKAMYAGNEGGGTVVAAGSSDEAQALLGKVVGFLSGTAYATHRTLHHASCLAMDEGTTPEQAAACFVNPLTALGMVETMRMEGHTALVHTVGASNLGQMLIRICLDEDVDLVNIVRKPEHVAMLRSAGARHVVDSSAESFRDDLVDAFWRDRTGQLARDEDGGDHGDAGQCEHDAGSAGVGGDDGRDRQARGDAADVPAHRQDTRRATGAAHRHRFER